jgi:hypothetical protein
MGDSVTIFSSHIGSTIPGDESAVWPWSYAKMYAQAFDWLRHEIAFHLFNTHLIEEVVIVATYLTICLQTSGASCQ